MAHISRRLRGDGKTPYYVVRWRPVRGAAVERSRTFARKADADAFLNALARGDYHPGGDRKTFRDALKEWQAIRTHRLAPSTLALEAGLLSNHVLPRWGTVRLVRIRPADLERWLVDLYGSLSPATVDTLWRLCKGPIRYAHDRLEWIPSDPTKGVLLKNLRPRREEPPPRVLERGEVEALADAVDPRYRHLVVFLAGTGLRIGEACALRVGDVVDDARAVRVRLTVREVRGRRMEGPPKTAAARRVVTLPESLRPIVWERAAIVYAFTADQQGSNEHQKKVSDALGINEFASLGIAGLHLFHATRRSPGSNPGDPPAPLTPGNWRRLFSRAAEAAGVPWATPHDLRHHHAAALLSAGVPLEAVSKRLGHADQSITAKVYAHLLEGSDEDAAAAYDRSSRVMAADNVRRLR